MKHNQINRTDKRKEDLKHAFRHLLNHERIKQVLGWVLGHIELQFNKKTMSCFETQWMKILWSILYIYKTFHFTQYNKWII